MSKKYIAGIDIGHGSNTWESGGGKGVKKNGKDYEEHDFNSKVGSLVNTRLKELGFKTVVAQPPFSKDVPLTTRTNKYNREKCDIVISIHANGGVPSASGACAFYWHTSTAGKKLANTLIDSFKENVDGVGTHGNGLHASMKGSWTNLHICRETNMPAVLFECGFMTNGNDFDYIFGKHQDQYVQQVSEAIVKAVCDYFGESYKEGSKEVPKAPSKGNYKIKKGDTFYSIAQSNGISVQDIQKANPKVNARNLQVGSSIVVPKKSSSSSKPSKTKYSLPKGVYKRGSKGNAVKQIQTGLNALNFNCGKVDGDYGEKTEDAVTRFQKVYDAYNVDGIYGSRTRTRMLNQLN